jgi:hypothetical protein
MVVIQGEWISITALFLFLLTKGWMRWSDPLIDFPRDLYMAWRVSVGDLLYVKIANWYGPLAQLVEGAGFKFLGVGMNTMVWMNIGLTVMILLLLRGIFGAIGNRFSVWLCSVVFVVAFAFGEFTLISNYNYITPYVAQATYTFAGLLLVVWALLRHLRTDARRWFVVAGVGAAIAYLDKPEGMFAALGALGTYFLARGLQVARHNPPGVDGRAAGRWIIRAFGWVVVGFFALWLPVLVYFWLRGGCTYAFWATNYMPISVWQSLVSGQAANSTLMRNFFGFDAPWNNFLREATQGLLLVLVCGALAWGGRVAATARPFRAAWWAAVVGLLVAAGAGIVLGSADNHWVGVGSAIPIPLFLTTLMVVFWTLRAAWLGQADFSRALGLAVVGVAASMMLSRMVLNARLGQYGFFMMPLAVLFWIQVMVVEAPRFRAPRTTWATWLSPVVFAFMMLMAVGQFLQIELAIYAGKTFAVGMGRDRFYTFPLAQNASQAKLSSTNGLMLGAMLEIFKLKTPQAQSLDVFPEGIAVNYHLRVPTTLAELNFDPMALSFTNSAHVVDELNAHPPDTALVFYLDLQEFNVRYFGETAGSGRDILDWLNSHYRIEAQVGKSPGTFSGDAVDLLVPNSPTGRGPP